MLRSWANLLTFSRFLIAPYLVWLILSEDWWLAALALAIAILSDIFDGKIARKMNQATAFGGLFDHATDAIFVSAAAWALAQLGLINGFLWVLILLAFAQYTLDSKALSGQVLRSSKLGRYNGIAYFVLICICVGCQCLTLQMLNPALIWAAWALVATSLLSMGDRLYSLVRLDA
jgi:CDP-diacylglycerol--glycerol-3-phosphate 3-phosphatidyltransferase|tara:strand:+ start:37 stop:561 length:525 start_codon:yes stop_codon:yes gene_type:complete